MEIYIIVDTFLDGSTEIVAATLNRAHAEFIRGMIKGDDMQQRSILTEIDATEFSLD